MDDRQPFFAATPVAHPVIAATYLSKDKSYRERLRPAPGDHSGQWLNWIYFFVKIGISIITVGALALLLVIVGSVLSYDGPDFRVFVTNSYLTSMKGDASVAWQILAVPSQDIQKRTSPYDNIKFEHFYECMWIANISACNNTPVLDDYTTCVNSRYSSLLSTCASQNSISAAWPGPTSYTSCLNTGMNGDRKSLNALRTCVKIRPWPLFDTPLDIDTSFFLGSFSWPMLMITGLFLFLSFAMYTWYPMDFEDTTIIEYGKPYSTGGFSRMGFCWMLFPLLMSLAWGIISVLIAFRAGSTWPNSNANPFPSTQTTNIISVTASFLVFFYFLMEIAEYYDRKKEGSPKAASKELADAEKGKQNPPPASAPEYQARRMMSLPISLVMPSGYQPGVKSTLGYFFPDQTERDVYVTNITDAGRQYTPVLLKTWADASLLDVLFFVGAFGATMQVQTTDIYNFFWILVFYRVANMGVVRMFYQSYVINNGEDDYTNKMKDQGIPSVVEPSEKERDIANASLCMKINGLAMHLAGTCALVIGAFLVYNPNRMWKEMDTFTALFNFGIIAPEAVKLAFHLYLVMRATEHTGAKAVRILVAAHFFWFWDILIRFIYLYYFFYGDTKLTGTKPFLVDSWSRLNSTLVYAGSSY